MSVNINDLISLAIAQMKADKKKTALLTGLCLVLLIAVVRLVIGGDDGPETAVAAVPTPAVAPMLEPTDKARSAPRLEAILPTNLFRSLMTPGGGLTSSSGGPQAGGLERTVEVDGMPRTLERDLFSVQDRSVFRPARVATWGGAESGVPGDSNLGIWGRMAAAISSHHESRVAITIQARDELSLLQLQATMTGSTPLAHISGRLVRENETIEGFKVVRITDRQVLLRKSGLTWRLSLP